MTNLKQIIARQEEKPFEEYAYQVKRTTCQAIFDHDINWCGDCYACSNCGKRFIWSGIANQKIKEILEGVVEMEKKNKKDIIKTAQTNEEVLVDVDYGWNKAKKDTITYLEEQISLIGE